MVLEAALRTTTVKARGEGVSDLLCICGWNAVKKADAQVSALVHARIGFMKSGNNMTEDIERGYRNGRLETNSKGTANTRANSTHGKALTLPQKGSLLQSPRPACYASFPLLSFFRILDRCITPRTRVKRRRALDWLAEVRDLIQFSRREIRCGLPVVVVEWVVRAELVCRSKS